MSGLYLTLAASICAYVAGRRSLGHGMIAVLTAGFFYGILRARYPDGWSHFIFDAAVLGFYFAQFGTQNSSLDQRAQFHVRPWLVFLIGWPVVLLCIPWSHPAIQLVGLRSAIYFLPFMLIGARASESDLVLLCRGLVVLNVICFGFAILEFWHGIESFYPRNQVTELIYRSNDVTEHSAYRIPATFPNAHAFAGTMLLTVPLLAGRVLMQSANYRERQFTVLALVMTLLGIFIAATRLPIVSLFAQLAILVVRLRARWTMICVGICIAGIVGLVVASDRRLQRFTTLSDSDYMAQRVHSSANLGALEMIVDRPFGVGLGNAVGTSIPFFLTRFQEGEQIGAENEFVRISLEQGIIGLLIWLAFIIATATRRVQPVSPPWTLTTQWLQISVIVSWATGWIGCGLLTSIPSTVLLLFATGVVMRYECRPDAVAVVGAGAGAGSPSADGAIADLGPGRSPLNNLLCGVRK